METELLVVGAAATWFGVLLAACRQLFAGALIAAAISFVVSIEIAASGRLDFLLDRSGGWFVIAEVIALGLLAFLATWRLPPWQAGVVVAVMLVAFLALGRWLRETPVGDFINTALVVGLAGCVGAGLLLRNSDASRRAGAEAARREERLALARELHDVVAHHVTGIVVQAQAGTLVAADAGRASEIFGRIETAGSEALLSMRRVVGALRVDEEAPTAPAAGIDQLRRLADHSAELGLPVRLHVRAGALPADVAQTVHNLVRESLTNARRHAVGATVVDVEVRRDGDDVVVSVADDGHGPARANGSGFGLTGMAERAAALGGRFSAGRRADGSGWLVLVHLPAGDAAPPASPSSAAAAALEPEQELR